MAFKRRRQSGREKCPLDGCDRRFARDQDVKRHITLDHDLWKVKRKERQREEVVEAGQDAPVPSDRHEVKMTPAEAVGEQYRTTFAALPSEDTSPDKGGCYADPSFSPPPHEGTPSDTTPPLNGNEAAEPSPAHSDESRLDVKPDLPTESAFLPGIEIRATPSPDMPGRTQHQAEMYASMNSDTHAGSAAASSSRGRYRFNSATPSTSSSRPLADIPNAIPRSSQPSNQVRGKGKGRVETLAEEKERLRQENASHVARITRLEDDLRAMREDNRTLRAKAANAYNTPNPDDDVDDDSNDGNSAEDARVRKKRRTSTGDAAEFVQISKHFAYFHALRLTTTEETLIFKEFLRGEGRQAEIYDGAKELFGDLKRRNFADLSTVLASARSEARYRVKGTALAIFDVSTPIFWARNSEFRKQANDKMGLAWTYKDFPTCKEGIFKSKFLVSAMSSLLHGPTSIREESAEKRAARGGDTKAQLWAPTRITRGFVAFTCSLVSNILRQEKSYKLPSNPKKSNLNLEIYDGVLDVLRRSSEQAEDDILDYLTEQLIPSKEDEEDDDDDETLPTADGWNDLIADIRGSKHRG